MLMDKELPCDFYFGDSRPGGIKSFETSLLTNFKGTLHNRKIIGPLFWQSGVLGLLKKGYTDFITPGETYCLSTWVLLLIARLRHRRVFLWTHGAYGDEKGLKKWITKMRVKLASGVFLYGDYAKRILISYGANKEKLHTIFNSLDYDTQKQMREGIKPIKIYSDKFRNNNANIIFIGRLTKVKKLNMILEAMSLLKKDRIGLNVIFVGDGAEKEHLKKIVLANGLENNVWFYGVCYDEQKISELIYNADICVSPGNVGLTAMHAMVFGTPVISHNNFSKQMPEFEAIEEGITGSFFKEDDVVSLSQTIKCWLLENRNREKTRLACYKMIDDKYNPHNQIELLKKIIRNI